MKRITTMLIAIAMICAFVGCSNNTSTSSAGSDTQTSVSDTTIDTNVDSVVSDTTTADTDASAVTSDETDNITSDTEIAEPEIYYISSADENYGYRRLEDGGVEMAGIAMSVRDAGTHIDAWHMIYPRELGNSPVLAADKMIDWPDQIVSVEFEDGYTRIPDDALLLAKGLETVIIPDTVTEIGQGAFANCTSLKEVNIPDNVTAIGDKTFYNCKDIVAAYRGETYTYDMIDRLYADINAE